MSLIRFYYFIYQLEMFPSQMCLFIQAIGVFFTLETFVKLLVHSVGDGLARLGGDCDIARHFLKILIVVVYGLLVYHQVFMFHILIMAYFT